MLGCNEQFPSSPQNRPRGRTVGCPFYFLLSRDSSLCFYLSQILVSSAKAPSFPGPCNPESRPKSAIRLPPSSQELLREARGGPAANYFYSEMSFQ